MRRVGLCLVSAGVVLGTALCVFAQPVVVQPNAENLSAAELAGFSEHYQRLSGLLASINLGSKKIVGQDGWVPLDFAKFSAGSIEQRGYITAIVEQTGEGIESRVWVLVGLDLGSRTIWIPIEPLPEPGFAQRTLGAVAGAVHAGGLVELDPAYMTFSSVVELPENLPPIAIIRPPAADVAEHVMSAWSGRTSIDPDGSIVLYEWTFDDDTQRMTAQFVQWFTFESSGTHTVHLTVTDSRGAQASTSLTLYVMTTAEYEAGCGCGG